MLHMNKIDDYYCEPMFLATAPVKEEIPQYFEIIEQEKIGTIVGLGQGKESNIEKFTTYLPLETFLEIKHGEFNIKNVHIILSGSYTVHFFDITKPYLPDWHQQLALIHIHGYPIETVPKDASKFSDILTVVQLYHEQQIVRNNLKGLLIHHTTGVHRSAAFCTLNIGRQMWLDQLKINVKGILQYVRKNRHGAFNTFGSSDKLLQFNYSIIQNLASQMDGKKSIKIKRHRIIVREQHLYNKHKTKITRLAQNSVKNEGEDKQKEKSVSRKSVNKQLGTSSTMNVSVAKQLPDSASKVSVARQLRGSSIKAKRLPDSSVKVSIHGASIVDKNIKGRKSGARK